jgi:hypothetical protein
MGLGSDYLNYVERKELEFMREETERQLFEAIRPGIAFETPNKVPSRSPAWSQYLCKYCNKYVKNDGVVENGEIYCSKHCATMDALGRDK